MDEMNTNPVQLEVQPIAPPTAPAAQGGKGISVAALVCGILGIALSWIPGVNFAAPVLSILGIIFGAVGMKKAKTSGEGKGLAIAGLVLGIVATAISVIVVAVAACAVAALASAGGLADLSGLM